MISSVMILGLCVPAIQDGDFEQALTKASEMSSYAFSMSMSSEGGGGGGGGRAQNGTGRFDREAGIEVKLRDGTYSGELTPEGARDLGSPGRGRRPGQGRGQGELTFAGSVKISVDSDGVVVKLEISTKASGKIRDREIDAKTTRTYEISEVGSAKVEIPEEAAKLFSE